MSVSVPKLVVLGLLSNGPRHGYEMEDEIERSNIRMWARIGMSSIYKALSDLEKEGHVSAKPGKALRGPGKKIFAIKASGKKLLEKEIQGALASTDPVYSLRMTGLAFALRQGEGQRPSQIEGLRASFEGLRSGVERLKAEKKRAAGSTSAQILLDYYLDIYKAELRAMERAIQHLMSAKERT